MGLAFLLAAALQAATVDPSQKVYEVEFVPLAPSERQYAASGPAGPYFPERAFRAHQRGESLLRCTAGPDGDLQQCAQAGEKPGGVGFADAALILAIRKRVRAAGAPPVGASILVRVPFVPGSPVNGMERAVRAPTVKTSALDVRGHAEVGCLVRDRGFDGCFVLYFRPMGSRPATPAAEFAAMANETTAVLAATTQASPVGLEKDTWVIIPVDVTPAASSKP